MKTAPRTGAAALVITLLFVVLVTVLVVGFLVSARTERVTASVHLERARATVLAARGVEQVVATLQRETADQSRNWISQPGQLTVPDPNGSNKSRLANTVFLSSGLPSGAASPGSVFQPLNLNIQTLQDTAQKTYLLLDPADSTTAAPTMNVRWLYVRKKDNQEHLELPDPLSPISATNLPVETPTIDPANPIIGRFAWWTDDESARVNANLAWTRDPKNTNGPGNQTKVDLRVLTGFDASATGGSVADALHNGITKDNYTTVRRFFNTPLDARQITQPNALLALGLTPADGTAIETALNTNRFNLTHYNHDPDTTYFGTARMVLTTQLGNAARRDTSGNVIMVSGKPLNRPFLDILKNPTNSTSFIEPGVVANIDPAKLNLAITNLVTNYLKKSDWPMVDGTGHSIQEKYYGTYTAAAREQRLTQLALNIIDYVRSAESKLTVVEPIRGLYVSSVFTGDFTDTSIRGKEDTFKGLTRGPHITEMGIWESQTPVVLNKKTLYRTIAFIEIYLPQSYGIDSLDLNPGKTDGKTWAVYFKEFGVPATGSTYYLHDGSTVATTDYNLTYRAVKDVPTATTQPIFVWEACGNPSKMVMKAGEYRTLAFEVWRTNLATAAPTAYLRGALFLGGTEGPRIDVTPLGDPPKAVATAVPKPLLYTIPVIADDTADPLTTTPSWETNDPRVNGVAQDWKASDTSKSPPNTFGGTNRAWTVGQSPGATVPKQDLDVNGKISNASLIMPYPAGSTQNPTGRVRSSGELGLIHTGIEGSSTLGNGGTPWRSLHLQPSSQDTTVVPDWAFMDLFTVPADTPVKGLALFAPHNNSTGGRVNMNAHPEPFPLNRTDPLAAVLFACRRSSLNATLLSKSDAQTIAQNIYNHTLATASGSSPAGKLYPAAATPNVYDSPGEVVEIKGVADQGEESEQLVRDIANLITSRGDVFSIYTVGQALQQTPAGKLIVTAERRQQALVERYLIDKNNNDASDDQIGFRTVYLRNLTP